MSPGIFSLGKTLSANVDWKTVEGFGDEWRRFDQIDLNPVELREQFDRYFRIFPWDSLSPDATDFDMGCGSGRWARLVAPRVGRLVCVDASDRALQVARRNLAHLDNCEFILASVESVPIADGTMDFGYSIGVLHHVPDTEAGIRRCVAKLKPGAPFLLYLYYALDNRPAWYRAAWRASDVLRRMVSRLPFGVRLWVTQGIALLVYFPLARISSGLARLGFPVSAIPLSSYRGSSFYTMRTASLDRFGTRLEKRFSRPRIREMMERAGLDRITFSDSIPYWCATGHKRGDKDPGMRSSANPAPESRHD